MAANAMIQSDRDDANHPTTDCSFGITCSLQYPYRTKIGHSIGGNTFYSRDLYISSPQNLTAKPSEHHNGSRTILHGNANEAGAALQEDGLAAALHVEALAHAAGAD